MQLEIDRKIEEPAQQTQFDSSFRRDTEGAANENNNSGNLENIPWTVYICTHTERQQEIESHLCHCNPLRNVTIFDSVFYIFCKSLSVGLSSFKENHNKRCFWHERSASVVFALASLNSRLAHSVNSQTLT